MRARHATKLLVGSFVSAGLLVIAAALANVETDGWGIAHTSPSQSGSYTTSTPIPFTDGFTWTARRVAPLNDPDSITVYCRDGWAKNGETTVSSTSKAKVWTGTDVTDWSDSANLDGSTTLSAGTYGYWARISRSINGGAESVWVNQLTGTSAQISGGFTVRP
jgi:hypothetical protein